MAGTELFSKLKDVLPEIRVEIKNNSNDLLGNNGQVTVYPKSEKEISEVLKLANNNGKKIFIEGGGTKRGFGGQMETADFLLSMAHYKGIIEHAAGDMTLTVKSGTPFKEIQNYLADYNQKIALDPSSPELATIGGIISANESGPKRLGYGSARDTVIGLRVVYPTGTVIRTGGKVVKNVAGYDMNKLFVGSMGTLGVLSEVTVKLKPLAKYESLVLLSFPEGNLEEIRSFAVSLLDSMMEPVALELLGPSLSERLTGRKQYTLAISFEDVESSVHYQEEFVKQIKPMSTRITIHQQNEAKDFWDAFHIIAPKGKSGAETEAALKIGVVNLDVLKVIKESHVLQDIHNLLIDAHGGLGHGLCQVYLKGAGEDILSAINDLREFVKSLGGYVIVKHLPFSLRQKTSVWGDKPSYFFLLEGIKTKVDPNRTLNDKRFVGGI
ncbi:glycolate oxidase FAD binding subunit [Bacillus oleivorans]|uniref:Glycolate oxidase FAD binding subunit n=1 Tax=Bacillus oleivorans TaxID=1448271 RepID=A0A285CMQ6_9BACI|nr:FAD-binding oxidoreductase [Bacillus oleivorans]SNX68336.1 glycolate oxidase FAD binding subunit [Bacillus oleivorans]